VPHTSTTTTPPTTTAPDAPPLLPNLPVLASAPLKPAPKSALKSTPQSAPITAPSPVSTATILPHLQGHDDGISSRPVKYPSLIDKAVFQNHPHTQVATGIAIALYPPLYRVLRIIIRIANIPSTCTPTIGVITLRQYLGLVMLAIVECYGYYLFPTRNLPPTFTPVKIQHVLAEQPAAYHENRRSKAPPQVTYKSYTSQPMVQHPKPSIKSCTYSQLLEMDPRTLNAMIPPSAPHMMFRIFSARSPHYMVLLMPPASLLHPFMH
jgi:hypothetical protein